MASRRVRQVGLSVALAWACWWVCFEGAEAIGDRQFTQAIVFVVAMFGGVLLAWKWPVAGGLLLIAEGLVSAIMMAPAWIRHFQIGPMLMLIAMMPVPPLAAGALLLLSRRAQR